jgi:hypothetical protein
MIIDPKRYTRGRIALANLSATIASLDLRRAEGASFEDLLALSSFCSSAATCWVESPTMTWQN